MTQEEIGAEGPGKSERVDPDAREPHARVVVEVPGGDELMGPGIEACQAGLPIGGIFEVGTKRPVVGEASDQGITLALVFGPDAGMMLEPALEIASPNDLLYKFFGGVQRMDGERLPQHFFLEHESMPDRRRQR